MCRPKKKTKKKELGHNSGVSELWLIHKHLIRCCNRSRATSTFVMILTSCTRSFKITNLLETFTVMQICHLFEATSWILFLSLFISHTKTQILKRNRLFLQCGGWLHDTTFGISYSATAAWSVSFWNGGASKTSARTSISSTCEAQTFICPCAQLIPAGLWDKVQRQALSSSIIIIIAILKTEYLIRPNLLYSLSWRTVNATRNNAGDGCLSKIGFCSTESIADRDFWLSARWNMS